MTAIHAVYWGKIWFLGCQEFPSGGIQVIASGAFDGCYGHTAFCIQDLVVHKGTVSMTQGRIKLTALVVVLTLISAVLQSANAAVVTFTQAQLTGMVPFSSSGFAPPGLPSPPSPPWLTANPTYQDGQTAMSGVAGATGNLNPNFTPPAEIYYSLNVADLAAFVAGLGPADILGESVYNDNNQPWEIGIWYNVGAGIVEDSDIVAPLGGVGLASLVLPDPGSFTYLGIGVFVRNVLSPVQSDDFHASWDAPPPGALPEPGSFVVWGLLSAVGVGSMVIRNRRRQAV